MSKEINKDIEVGDYVRTNDGRIFRVYKIDNKNFKYTLYSDEFTRPINYKVTKHSKNIIDLIEVGDFVNGYRVLEMFKFQNDKYAFTTCKSDFKSICRIWSEEDIETILTKEQYSQNCYTVEREEKC